MIAFTPKQSAAMDAVASENYNFILFGGALGGGKTVWGLSALLIMCQIFPRSRWCVIRENSEKIRTTTIPSFKKLNPSGKLRENPFEYTHPNGSIILFKGENYDNDKELLWMRGLEVCGFLFEEINECQEMTLDIAFSRAGRWECDPRPKPIILATCNPSNSWIKPRVFDKWKTHTLPDNWLYIQSKVTDNPYLTEDYINNLKNLPRYQYEVFVEGNWDLQLKIGGEFYKCFELDKHVGVTAYNPELPLHISWDDNVNPYLPCGIFQIKGKEVHMIDEISGINPNNTIKAVCGEIIRKYQGHKAGMFVYGDATAQKEDTKMEKGHNFFRLIVDYLAQFRPQLRVLKANPSVVMRGNWINTVLEKELNGLKIVIGENCKNTINDFILLKEAADGTKAKEMDTDPKTKVRYQKVGHYCFTGDTMVKTIYGDIPIKNIRQGDYVLTRKGYKKVLATHDNGVKRITQYIIGGIKIKCTPNHFFWTKEYGFIEVARLINRITFCIFDENSNTWKEKLLPITEQTLSDTLMLSAQHLGSTIQDGLKSAAKEKKKGCTGINICAKKAKYLKGMIYTMLMETTRTMTFVIYRLLKRAGIFQNTYLINLWSKREKELKSYELLHALKQANGIGQKRVENGTGNWLKKIKKLIGIKESVLNVPPLMKKHLEELLNIAPTGVEKELQQEILGLQERVYDLSIEDEHEYFANGVLVSNTDLTDYLLCSAFAADFARYQAGSVVQSINYGKNNPSKNSY